MKSHHRNSTVELSAMFNSETKCISTRTMWRDLKELELNSCLALRKLLMSDANRGKKGHVVW